MAQTASQLANLQPGYHGPTGAGSRKKVYFDYQDIVNDRLSQHLSAKCPFASLSSEEKHVIKVKTIAEHLMDKLIVMALRGSLPAIKMVLEISNGQVPGNLKSIVSHLAGNAQDASYSQAVHWADERITDIIARVEKQYAAAPLPD